VTMTEPYLETKGEAQCPACDRSIGAPEALDESDDPPPVMRFQCPGCGTRLVICRDHSVTVRYYTKEAEGDNDG